MIIFNSKIDLDLIIFAVEINFIWNLFSLAVLFVSYNVFVITLNIYYFFSFKFHPINLLLVVVLLWRRKFFPIL